MIVGSTNLEVNKLPTSSPCSLNLQPDSFSKASGACANDSNGLELSQTILQVEWYLQVTILQHVLSAADSPTMFRQPSITKYGLIHLGTKDHILFEKNFSPVKVTQGNFNTFRNFCGGAISFCVL